jgi:hypothetical protein
LRNASDAIEALFEAEAALRCEARTIFEDQGLYRILSAFGHVEITGSYALELMTWRDLDTYVMRDGLTVDEFFALGAQVNTALNPTKMHFRNERIGRTPGLPSGLYWGVYLGQEAGSWKIDIWAVGTDEGRSLIEHCQSIWRRLTPEARQRILEIKSACWQHPLYRKGFSGADVYRAVLDHSVRDFTGFAAWLEASRGIRISGRPS